MDIEICPLCKSKINKNLYNGFGWCAQERCYTQNDYTVYYFEDKISSICMDFLNSPYSYKNINIYSDFTKFCNPDLKIEFGFNDLNKFNMKKFLTMINKVYQDRVLFL